MLAGPRPLRHLLTRLLRRGRRCPHDHYATFLRRRVRCTLEPGHGAHHRYATFDETVRWTE